MPEGWELLPIPLALVDAGGAILARTPGYDACVAARPELAQGALALGRDVASGGGAGGRRIATGAADTWWDAHAQPAVGRPGLAVVSLSEATEHARVEHELELARKLEAVGQLASGIAHEINTPIQFIGDTAAFLQEAHDDLIAVLDHHRELALTVDPDAVAQIEDRVDLEDLRMRLPRASARIIDGVGRVATIVRAMKGVAPAATRELTPVDLDQLIADTLVVARSEYKQVAQVTTDLDAGGDILCSHGGIGQVLLNLVVNAAHAIRAAQRDTPGTISVRSHREGANVVVEVADDGIGATPGVLARVFDPFFTTKEVGSGTGQGLAIAHRIVTEQHGGTITLDSDGPGAGARVTFRIPVGGRAA